MPDEGDVEPPQRGKRRVLKAPAVRRAELIACAQALFLAKGYDRTTINDVIAATRLSKGAFYHHFRAKEDLLEAIAAGFARESLAYVESLRQERSLSALQRLNSLMAMSREWKIEHLAQLKAMFTTLLAPGNEVLYHRIVGAVFAAMAPAIAKIIEEGQREGAFDVSDPQTAAEILLWLGDGRRVIVVDAMAVARAGDVEEAVGRLLRRLRAEGAMVDRILGLAPGSVDLAGSGDGLRSLIVAWNDDLGAAPLARADVALSRR